MFDGLFLLQCSLKVVLNWSEMKLGEELNVSLNKFSELAFYVEKKRL